MATSNLRYRHEIPNAHTNDFGLNFKSSAASIDSDMSYATTILEPQQFHLGTQLRVAAHGLSCSTRASSSSEAEVPIYHSNGSLAYTSTRQKPVSSNTVLSHPELGDLTSTTYFFGPNRDPIIRFLDNRAGADDGANTVKFKTQWLSRNACFTTSGSRTFEWSYSHTKDPQGKRVNVLVLRHKVDGRAVAQLLRGNDTRTPGSSKWAAGNGGLLVLDQDATSYLDEVLIVATCLVMLKREVDRKRRG